MLPNFHSPICVILLIFNLALGIETCFYNSMTNFFEMCLQLAFLLLLIMISSSLIIGSQYSSRIQRLKARKGLHIITGVPCFVLLYSNYSHLSSRQIKVILVNRYMCYTGWSQIHTTACYVLTNLFIILLFKLSSCSQGCCRGSGSVASLSLFLIHTLVHTRINVYTGLD